MCVMVGKYKSTKCQDLVAEIAQGDLSQPDNIVLQATPFIERE